MNIPRAYILAGGFGTRLKSVVPDRPKVLAEIKGRPFLAWVFDALQQQGIQDVVLCTHYMNDQIQSIFPPGLSFNGINISYSVEPEPLGTGGALRLAIKNQPPPQFPLLALNGDTLCDFDLVAMLCFHSEHKAIATILTAGIGDPKSSGLITYDDGGYITAFQEKTDRQELPLANAGVYLLGQQILASIPKDKPVSIERDVFPKWAGRGLYAFKSKQGFLDIGTPENFAKAQMIP